MTKEFQEKAVDKALAELLEGMVEKDLQQIIIPEDVLTQIKTLQKIREEIDPNKIDKYLVPYLLSRQTMIAGAKYLIGRHLSLMKGAQSYAYIFRKFKTASEWTPTKERLGNMKDKAPTINEIEGEIEKKMVDIRKTEVAYQVAGDKLVCLLDWCSDMILIIQNRLRAIDTEQKTIYAEQAPNSSFTNR